MSGLIDNPKELLEFIANGLKPKQKEKKENGEVFTPMHLVFEMLDNLDNYYTKENGRSIFSEPAFKWFDPSSGMGNFPIAVYLKLMGGLEFSFPDKATRKKHILENMLYMSELNEKNVSICRQIFDIGGEYQLNLYEGNTLTLDTANEWKVDSFDVILGNPPYNRGGIRSFTGEHLGEKNETIWPLFVEMALKQLKPDGFLVFITPLSWLKKRHSLHDYMLDRYVIWLKLWNSRQTKPLLCVAIPISAFILQNTNKSNKTQITSILQDGSISTSMVYLDKKYTIPLAFYSIFDKLIKFIEKNNLQLEYHKKNIKSIGTKQKLPTDYSLKDIWAVETHTNKDGIQVKKAAQDHPDANKRKLIIANKCSFRGVFIDEGKLSLTGRNKYYILGGDLEIIKKMLSFDIIKMVGEYTKYSMGFLDQDAFAYIPDLRKLGKEVITEADFYKMIGLTKEEINIFT